MSGAENKIVVRFPVRALRIGMLTRAAELIGPARLAAALDIQPRSLRAKLSSDRTIGDSDLARTAEALDRLAKVAAAQASAIRRILPDGKEASQ